MTYSDLKFYESEVKELVNKVLDAVRDKSFPNYVLLLARGGYQVENEKTFLSPYVICSHLEIYQDRTREQFLVGYLNTYASLLEDGVFMTDDYKEYDLNIQMMIYAQIWESHQFLKILKRIGGILTGKPYEWKISFEYVNEKGKIKSFPKGKMMDEHILVDLRSGYPEFANIIEGVYDGELRNAFAHASYFIDVEKNVICSFDSERYAIKKSIDLFDWERMFAYSVLLSYYLPNAIHERCNRFIQEHPNVSYVDIDWPSYNESGKILKAQIYPEKRKWGVEFNFRRKDSE